MYFFIATAVVGNLLQRLSCTEYYDAAGARVMVTRTDTRMLSLAAVAVYGVAECPSLGEGGPDSKPPAVKPDPLPKGLKGTLVKADDAGDVCINCGPVVGMRWVERKHLGNVRCRFRPRGGRWMHLPGLHTVGASMQYGKWFGEYRKGVCAWWEVIVFWLKFAYIFASVLGGTDDPLRFRVFSAVAVVALSSTLFFRPYRDARVHRAAVLMQATLVAASMSGVWLSSAPESP
eukprot:gene8950-47450_t